MIKTFSELNVGNEIQKALYEMGFEEPTDVQSEAIPKVLEQKDIIVMAKTGSGKTAAFGIPILQLVGEEKYPQALILTPTRELAVQVDSEMQKMSKHHHVRTTAVYGRHSMDTEIGVLKKGVHVVTGTPGRVFDHIKKKTLNTKNIKYIVLDEADRMLDMGFIEQVTEIIRSLPKDRTTMLFSATIPDEIQKIIHKFMKEPEFLDLGSETKTVDAIEQMYYRVEKNKKRIQLVKILRAEQPGSCMVFCNTRDEVDRVEHFLHENGYYAEALHGTKNQNVRLKTIKKFKENEIQILIATDVAARGLHIDDMELVINYDVPFDKDSYVHRIGRTGRAGNGGKAVSLVTVDDIMNIYAIEEHIGVLIEEIEFPSDEKIEENVQKSISKWKDMKRPFDPNEYKVNEERTQKPKKAKRKTTAKPQNKNEQTRSHKHKNEEKSKYRQERTQNIHPQNVTPIETSYKKENKPTEYISEAKTNSKDLGYDLDKVNAMLERKKQGKVSIFDRIRKIFKG